MVYLGKSSVILHIEINFKSSLGLLYKGSGVFMLEILDSTRRSRRDIESCVHS